MAIAIVVAAAVGVTVGLAAVSKQRIRRTADAVNMNCTLIVPTNPLSATGLATPYQITATNPADGPCNEANANQSAFVQAAVIDPATGQISVYNPLVIDQGTTPAVAPVVPALPAGGVVGIWFGFNGNTLSFVGADQAGATAAAAAPAATAAAAPTATGAATPTPIGTGPATAVNPVVSPAATPSVTAAAGGVTTPTVTGTTPPAGTDTPAASGTPDAILQGANCVAGEDIAGQGFSSFTQVAACNATAFFQAANTAIQAGLLTVPSPGTAVDGQPCLTTRNFGIIDQDQSDNVTAEYLANGNGQTAQDTAANQTAVAGSTTLFNGSDNGLIDFFVDPALGCTPWKVPDLANNGTPATALPLDEIQSAAFDGNNVGGPEALVPLNDPMTLDNNGNFSTDKTNAYRALVDMTTLPTGQTPAEYCGDMESIQGVRLQQDVNLLIGKASPLATASNLFTFLASRLQASFVNLNCQNYGLNNDVSITMNGNGVAVAACFLQQVNAVTTGAGNPTFGMTVCPTTVAGTSTAAPTASASASASAATPSPTSTAILDVNNVSCDIIVPANPLSAQGLATPYQLTGINGTSPQMSGCEMSNAANLGAFVQATILDPATGALSVYDPLVITKGTTPAVAPTVPTLPADAVVTVDFGFNGTNLTQVGATPNTLRRADCVGGAKNSIFGQVSFCNGINFFNAAFQDEQEGKLVVPSEGTSGKIIASGGALGTGQDCPVTRNFNMIDQDPSDNVTTEYLLNPATGQTAQDTTSNAGNLPGSTLLLNGSDNTLLDLFLDPTLGCTPFQAPDLANNNMPTSSQALDELLAAKNQPAIPALVPENDEMTLVNNAFSAAKTDLYREEVGQAPISAANNVSSSPAMYCQNMVNIQTPFLAANQALLATGQSPVTAVGDNLFTFMANRLNMSFTNLACQNFGLTNPVTVTLDGNGVAIAATFVTTPQTATNTTAQGMPTQGQRKGRSHHRLMNPSGM
jgi:hypothetical protein